MPLFRLWSLTLIAMLAFAANSLLCRMALAETDIDAASFTSIRLASGALTLWLILQIRSRTSSGAAPVKGDWISALALFTYAAGFSFAYISLPTATGALLLFGGVQVLMIGYGLVKGERPGKLQSAGMLTAAGGLLYLLLPGAEAPSLSGTLLMLAAAAGWAVYSLRGRGKQHPTAETAGNFLRAVPVTLVLSLFALIFVGPIQLDSLGLLLALASGAFASGMGYALWYAVLPHLEATIAAAVQLTVPAIAALAGVLILSEPMSERLIMASVLILGGVAITILAKRWSVPAQ